MLREKSYDVIIVGAGFAGSIVAAKIAQEGVDLTNGERLKIALLEWGPYFKGKPRWGYGIPSRRQLFTHIPQDMRQRIGANRRALGGWWTQIGVGGGSLHWGGKGHPPDDKDYEWWARETGVDWTKETMKPAVDELLRLWNSHTVPDELLQEYHFRFRDAAQSMGYQTRKMLIHKKNCIMCGTHYEAQPQCRYDAKMSTLLSHIPAAEENGVEIVPHTKVEQVILEKRGAQWVATGVWYREKGGPAERADAKNVILAGGSSTVSLLYASGYGPKDLLGDKLVVENPNVGSHVEGHPRLMGGVTARFEDLIVHEPGDGNFGFWFLDDTDGQGSERLFIGSGADTHGSSFWGAHSYALSPWAPEFGHKHKAWMRDNWKVWRHIAGGPFYLAPLVAYSHWSAPKARILPDESLQFDQEHPSMRKRQKECRDLLRSLFEKMGAKEIRHEPSDQTRSSPMIHEVGGCRAGADRKNSVVKLQLRVSRYRQFVDRLFQYAPASHKPVERGYGSCSGRHLRRPTDHQKPFQTKPDKRSQIEELKPLPSEPNCGPGTIRTKKEAPVKQRGVFRLFCSTVLFVAPGLGRPAGPAEQPLVIEGGTLIDGTGASPVEVGAIVVENGRIREVGRPGQRLAYPENAKVITAAGKYILPGLIDGHVHLRGWDVELYPAFGVTTVVDAGNPTEWILLQREGVQKGKVKGPRIFFSGNILAGAPRIPERDFQKPIFAWIDSADLARQETRRLIEAGAHLIKLYPGLTTDALQAVVAEAHAAGLPVVGHVNTAREALDVGYDAIFHMGSVAGDVVSEANDSDDEFDVHAGMDFEKVDSLIKTMVDKGVYFDHLLRSGWNWAHKEKFQYEDFDLLFNNIALRYIPLDFRLGIVKEYNQVGLYWYQDLSQERRELVWQAYKNSVEFVRRFHQAGGKLLTGSDTISTGGLSLHQSLEILVKDVGVSPADALLSVTKHPATLYRLSRDLGSIHGDRLRRNDRVPC